MMPTVVLSVLEDKRVSQEFRFEEGRTACTVGRSLDCDLPLPADVFHWTVSRHHCRIEVRSSGVWVRDLGSLNGTYVNGLCIGGRERAPAHEPGRRFPLHTGDEVRVGDTILCVEVEGVVAADEGRTAVECVM
jgi:pSer/pThr/pTyr-binding forkhead associated (FHA) protein